ncbi:cytochrome P450 2G1-like [Lingula anatina]|uniref:Cytochrome P450 2U1 n=1 Tax=Lingula anatina TaxID=7574 RepID=A0A1S3HWI0_LINAN|nr:cytochrome P450 2G1-like [Lingula anatina]|eukprot:XP_013390373.1 cytochrome P450 2G1-like [Lingula anatina]
MSVAEKLLRELPAFDVTTILIFVAVFFACLLLVAGVTGGRHSKLSLPPGPPGWPVLGSLLFFIRRKDPHPSDLKPWVKKYGDILYVSMGPQGVVFLNSHDSIQEAFVRKSDQFSSRPIWLFLFKSIVGPKGAGVIFSNGQKWRDLRRFTLTSLRDFGMGKKTLQESIQHESRLLVQDFEKFGGEAFDPGTVVQTAVNNIISIVVFGERHEYSDQGFNEMLDLLNTLLRLSAFGIEDFFPWTRHFIPNSKMKKRLAILKELYDRIRDHVNEHRLTFDPNNLRDFIDLYIKVTNENNDPETFSEKNIFRVVVDLYFAGTETTASTLKFGLLQLLHHPDIQKKCQEEIDRVIGPERAPKGEDRLQMPFTEATLMEIMRYSPVVPNGVPHATETDAELHGYLIPKGTVVFPNIYHVLRDPANFDRPDEFRPERWLDDSGQVIKTDKLINFSVGPRTCLGKTLAELEAFIFFTTMLQQFSFQPAEGQDIPSPDRGQLVPNGVPHATETDAELHGYLIPKGTVVFPNIYYVLRDPANFDRPDEFRPERWLDDSGRVIKTDKLINFSVGPRTCLGKTLAELEAFIFFTTMLQQFSFQPAEGQDIPSPDRGQLGITYTPFPFKIRAVRR